jgi:hypothetical protein
MSMRKRLEKKSDKVVEEMEVESVDSDEDESSEEETVSPGKGGGSNKRPAGPPGCCDRPDGKKTKPPSGFNYSAMAILFLFIAIPILTGLSFLYDYLNPTAGAERAVYSNLYRCYNAVGDNDKIANIDNIVKKYKGKERSLYSQLRGKYGEEFPECDKFRS